jgi:hypothetical protein
VTPAADARSQLPARGRLLLWAALASACGAPVITGEGLLGRQIPLVTGDELPLPRLAFIDEGCPGDAARGGCAASGDRQCGALLVDSLAPLTALKGTDDTPQFEIECLEVRAGTGLAATDPTAADLDAAVARFRFHDVPLVRAPADGTDDWTWLAGSGETFFEPAGVVGGNLLSYFSIAMRHPPDAAPSLAFYVEFPGSEADLADQGRAFLAVQFPGRLLGRDIGDRCEIGDDGCRVEGFDLVRAQPNFALRATRMVLDACVAAPPCGVRYEIDALNPFALGECSPTRGPDLDLECIVADDPIAGGERASLVVATAIPGAVLFADSAVRMFGSLDALVPCASATLEDRACLEANDGVLAAPGWPVAGLEVPLPRIRVRTIALVPGSTRSRDVGPCERVQERRDALFSQCDRYVDAVELEGDVRNTTPPYSAEPDGNDEINDGDAANTSLAVLGEHVLLDSGVNPTPDVEQWIEVLVLSQSHPLAVSVRLDVAPEAVQPDGLIGSAMLEGTATVLDYTDPNPAVRLSCFDPRAGSCMVATDCRVDAQPACCHGLPLNLLVEFIVLAQDETCCSALSGAELGEIQEQGFCLTTEAP